MSDDYKWVAAFPTLDSTLAGLTLREPGMALRDYFAAKAMQSLLLDPRVTTMSAVAIGAYTMADSMLEARINND